MDAPKMIPGEKFGQWLRTYRWPIFFSILYLTLIPIRDFWSPDEPDFAQAVREMIEKKNGYSLISMDSFIPRSPFYFIG